MEDLGEGLLLLAGGRHTHAPGEEADDDSLGDHAAEQREGPDLGALVETMGNTPDGSNKPVAIIANTVKGKGVSFMEDDNNWHYRSPNADEVAAAFEELGLA